MDLFKGKPKKTLRYKLKQSEWDESCKKCTEGKVPIQIPKETNVDTGWTVAAGLVLVFAIIWVVYIKWFMRIHIKKLVKDSILDEHLGELTSRAVAKEVHNRVYYSYADLKNRRVEITVGERTDSFQGE